ncbi:type VII secretion integral membrane protein EccD [Mycobacterium sp. TY815]|uniref:type VII secretion integral membrane protein EccD n=1 Tax=Mycobacterium sp. TY815 TaxID=3050581 RepID=UPI0027408B1D|nr:type VII secretion integral membrane protein EccD [Mycobacterium sp. TY815]MDP7707375.1 type VII secretion integral membrane protein EccD [Mycobacterium sp. TY815]
MTAVVGQASGVVTAAKVRLREQVRVAVLFDGRQTDMALPATETVATVAADVLRELLEPGETIRPPDSGQLITPGTVVLKRVTGTPLNRTQSLAAQHIKDGDLLILDVEDAPVSLTPVVENASSAIAQFNAQRFASVTPHTAIQFAACTVFLCCMLATGLLVNMWRLELVAGHQWPVLPAATAAAITVTFTLSGALVQWRRRIPLMSYGFWGGSLIAGSAAGFIAVPGPADGWHAVLASAITLTITVTLWRLTAAPKGVLAWLTLTATGVFAIALAYALGVKTNYICIAALFVALLVLKGTESFAQLLARVPMPPFPTVTGKLAFDDAEEIASQALVAAETNGTPSVSELQRSANAANSYQRAIVAATAPFFILAAAGAVTPGHGRWWLATVYTLMLALVLVFRGRSFADRAASITVVATAFTMAAGVSVKYAATSTDPLFSLASAAFVLSLGLAALLVAAVVPRRVFSAPFRKAVEWLDYALQVCIPPLVFWLLNLYFLTRNAL